MAVYSPLSDGCLFFEYDILDMVPHIDRDKIRGFIPLRLSGHIIVDEAPVDFETLEKDVLYLALLVVAVDDGHVGLLAIVADVAEGNVFDTTTGSRAVLVVVAHSHLEQRTLVYVLDAYVVEEYVFDVVVVSAVDGHATLVIDLRFALADDVDVLVHESHDAVGLLGVAVYADEDGVCHIGPEGGVAHAYIVHRTLEPLAGGIGGGAVVRGATEHTVVGHVGRGKDVEPVSP